MLILLQVQGCCSLEELRTWVCWDERMDEAHLSVFHSVSNRDHGKRSRNSISSAARYAFNSFFLVRARDCTTFTLHDLADFYVESATAHSIKRNDHSCFHNRWPNSKTKLKWKHLWEQGGSPGVSGALRSLRILRIGRIGSDLTQLLVENNPACVLSNIDPALGCI